MIKAIVLSALISAPVFSGQISDSYLGYSITLPVNWVQVKSRELQHYFRDSTRIYHSQISIVRYPIDKAAYPTPESWTQAQFIAYKISVEHSVFPYGTLVFYDSTAMAKLGTKWAPEAFSVLYPADGDPTYAEYIRYCANGDFGYEIYAIGDSTDMTNRVDFYAGLIASIDLSTPTSIGREVGLRRVSLIPEVRGTGIFDLTGRRISLSYKKHPTLGFRVSDPSNQR